MKKWRNGREQEEKNELIKTLVIFYSLICAFLIVVDNSCSVSISTVFNLLLNSWMFSAHSTYVFSP